MTDSDYLDINTHFSPLPYIYLAAAHDGKLPPWAKRPDNDLLHERILALETELELRDATLAVLRKEGEPLASAVGRTSPDTHGDPRLARLRAKRQAGTEPLHADGIAIGGTLLGFWQWSASDLLSNATRGRLAEYLVGRAVGAPVDCVRDEWDAFDLTTPEGVRVEVKSAAYVQSWRQKRLSTISFRCPRTRAWSADAGAADAEPRRQADVYVFALLHHTDKSSVDPLNVRQWSFFVVPTRLLDARTRSQHSITLPSLETLVGAPVSFEALATAIRGASEAGTR